MVNTGKKVKFIADRGRQYSDFVMVNIIFENESICLCESDLKGKNKVILFDKKDGKVLTENVDYGCYYAENY